MTKTPKSNDIGGQTAGTHKVFPSENKKEACHLLGKAAVKTNGALRVILSHSQFQKMGVINKYHHCLSNIAPWESLGVTCVMQFISTATNGSRVRPVSFWADKPVASSMQMISDTVPGALALGSGPGFCLLNSLK